MAGKTKTIKLGLRLSHLYYITNNMNSQIIENVKMNIKNGLELFDKMAIERGLEIWKPIKDYPNYEVSSLGNVKNVTTGKVLKPRLNKKTGYNSVFPCKDGINHTYNLHRLVALAFIPNHGNKPYVDHINGIKTCNNVRNLRWATAKENQHNMKMMSTNQSGVKGVHYCTRDKKYIAKIFVSGKAISIGYFNNLEDAKEARQKKAKELFGKYVNSCEL